MAVDPVCKMNVDESKAAATYEYKGRTMKKTWIALTLAMFLGIGLYPLAAYAQMGRGYQGGAGMMGHGMMGRGWGMAPGYGYGFGHEPQYQQPRASLDKEAAKSMVEDYLKSTKNPNLKLGEIEDKGDRFVAEILTKEGSLVDKLAIDKNTGQMASIY